MSESRFSLSLERDEAFAFTVRFDDAALPALTVDEMPPLGAARGPNPARLLGVAVGHCLSASLLFCLQKARVDVKDVTTRVRGRVARDADGRWRIAGLAVDLEPATGDVPPERLERCLGMFEDYCIVTQSVRQGIEIDVQVKPAVGAAST
jgi:uncharacterized OsmC-like protein